jgi:hypothetical protein
MEQEMNNMRRSTLSLAAFVLICFFLPWVQLSCVGLKDSVSGYDLAREGDQVLWFVPLFMLAILMLGLLRFVWEKLPAVFALAGTVGGSLSAYLMYRERSMTNSSSKIAAKRSPPLSGPLFSGLDLWRLLVSLQRHSFSTSGGRSRSRLADSSFKARASASCRPRKRSRIPGNRIPVCQKHPGDAAYTRGSFCPCRSHQLATFNTFESRGFKAQRLQ